MVCMTDMSDTQKLCSSDATFNSASIQCRAAEHAEHLVKKVLEEAENVENVMRKVLTDAWNVSFTSLLFYSQVYCYLKNQFDMCRML